MFLLNSGSMVWNLIRSGTILLAEFTCDLDPLLSIFLLLLRLFLEELFSFFADVKSFLEDVLYFNSLVSLGSFAIMFSFCFIKLLSL
jgi:hypothetical protein